MSIFSRKTVEVQEPLLDHTIYLIDTENVRTVWTMLLDRMTVNDKIYVFYTMNSGNVSYEDLKGVLSSGKSVELIQCHTGKNGLDFQLVSYLGYLIHSNENADYCIISDDSGYDAVIKFWEDRDVDVTRKTAFQVSGKQAKPQKKSLFGVKSKPKAQAQTQPTKQPNIKSQTSKSDIENKQAVKSQTSKIEAEKTQSVSDQFSKTDAESIHAVSNHASRKDAEKTQAVKKQVSQTESEKTESVKKQMPRSEADKPRTDNKVSDKSQAVKLDGDKTQTAKPKPEKKQFSGSMEDRLKTLFPDENEERIGEISEIIRKSGGKKGLADIHDEIEKLYRSEKASEVYRAIRHNFNDIYC